MKRGTSPVCFLEDEFDNNAYRVFTSSNPDYDFSFEWIYKLCVINFRYVVPWKSEYHCALVEMMLRSETERVVKRCKHNVDVVVDYFNSLGTKCLASSEAYLNECDSDYVEHTGVKLRLTTKMA